jgi:hypothetical protein
MGFYFKPKNRTMKNNIQIQMKKLAFVFLLALFFSIVASSHAQGNYRIIAVQRGTSNIVEVATDTGSLTFLFNLPFTANYEGMDYNPVDGFLYIAHENVAGNQLDFYKLDLVVNTATYVKTINGIGTSGASTSIGFTASGDVYAYSDPSGGGSGTLYFISWATGNVQSLGSSGTPAILGGDYDRTRNIFWACDESYGKVYQLSVTNAAILWTSTSTWSSGNASPNYLGAVNISPSGDILISATGNNGNAVRILKLNPSTGLWTTNLTVNVNGSIGNGSLRFASFPGPTVNLVKVVTVNFSNLSVGTNYQLQISTDLNSWTNFGTSFIATNSFMNYSNYWNVSDWNQLFFRLH